MAEQAWNWSKMIFRFSFHRPLTTNELGNGSGSSTTWKSIFFREHSTTTLNWLLPDNRLAFQPCSVDVHSINLFALIRLMRHDLLCVEVPNMQIRNPLHTHSRLRQMIIPSRNNMRNWDLRLSWKFLFLSSMGCVQRNNWQFRMRLHAIWIRTTVLPKSHWMQLSAHHHLPGPFDMRIQTYDHSAADCESDKRNIYQRMSSVVVTNHVATSSQKKERILSAIRFYRHVSLSLLNISNSSANSGYHIPDTHGARSMAQSAIITSDTVSNWRLRLRLRLTDCMRCMWRDQNSKFYVFPV